MSALVRSRAGSGWKADSCCMRWCCPASPGEFFARGQPDPDRIYSPVYPACGHRDTHAPEHLTAARACACAARTAGVLRRGSGRFVASAHGCNHIANWANSEPQRDLRAVAPKCRSTRRTCDGFSTPSRCLCRWASAWTRPTGSRRSRRAVRPPRSASRPAMSCCGSTAWRCGTGSCRSPRRSIARSPRTSSCCAASTRFAPPTSSRSMAGHRRSGPSSCRCPWASA